MRLVVDIGAVRPKRIKQWNFYKRDEERIHALKTRIGNEVRTTLRRRDPNSPLPFFADAPTEYQQSFQSLISLTIGGGPVGRGFQETAAQCVEPRSSITLCR